MMVAGMQVPTLDEITKKEQTIKEALNYKFNDKDIEDVSLLTRSLMDFFCFLLISCGEKRFSSWFHLLQIVKEKDRFRKAPPNYAMKKTQLLKDKVAWAVSGRLQEVSAPVSLRFIARFPFEGDGRRERGRRPSEGDPGRAERAGGEGRGPGPTEDQEHLSHQVPAPRSRPSPVSRDFRSQTVTRTIESFCFPLCSYINQRNRSWNIVESEKALVVSVKYHLSNIHSVNFSPWILTCLLFFPQAEGQNAKNQQMDPFTRRQCKPTMVSNVRFAEWLKWGTEK